MLRTLEESAPNRRETGSYYTPDGIARAIISWALRAPTDRILEPSFGEGAFVAAALDRLAYLGGQNSHEQIEGFDIDPAACSAVRSLLMQDYCITRLRQEDFLETTPPTTFAAQFDCVVGNPPFVRHHRIRKSTTADLCRARFKLPRTADLWCSFFFHSLDFLRRGGRIAFVLPSSLMFAAYAESVRESLASRFQSVTVIRLAFPAFAASGADQGTLIVLADGFCDFSRTTWKESIAWSEADVIEHVGRWNAQSSTAFLSQRQQLKAIEPLLKLETTELGDLATLRIGIVTGANRFFVVSDATRKQFRLPSHFFHPVLARASHASGLRFGLREHAKAAAQGKSVLLFVPRSLGKAGSPVRRYLSTIPRSLKENTLWFRKRPRWYCPEIGAPPHAALTYMNHVGPRIILLSGIAAATNTFHAVRFNRQHSDSSSRRAIALSLLTSVAQLSAEIEGRAYGGGLLKIEPAGARRLLLPLWHGIDRDTIDQKFHDADALLREARHGDAMHLADDLLLKPKLGSAYERDRAVFLETLRSFRQLRMGSRNTANPTFGDQ